jgi:inositol 1,4,5-triphosphate receptor type 1/inositol 1,4,5-triphosphate receptor type 3
VDRSSVKAKVQGLVERNSEYIKIMIHEEKMKLFYYQYPVVGFFANYIQLWKDIAYYLTLLLNIIIIMSFSMPAYDLEDEGNIPPDRMESYIFFRDTSWTTS